MAELSAADWALKQVEEVREEPGQRLELLERTYWRDQLERCAHCGASSQSADEFSPAMSSTPRDLAIVARPNATELTSRLRFGLVSQISHTSPKRKRGVLSAI